MFTQLWIALRLHSILLDVEHVHLILRRGVRGEVREHEKRLAVAEQPVDHGPGVIGLCGGRRYRIR